ncbi:hypothetical protein J4E86_010279 [Alternaria arbusti]|uniref:uncharacterized protein n=1 Tax=Alternaria arbusti TaxID=232088 RepID=UPI002220141A|nr:uncharacterized protein J4E86_010279 [Alternaria arbusti]KAI4941768.1 hypothetical protein J4E86_010279 [Alternaria arbusti]
MAPLGPRPADPALKEAREAQRRPTLPSASRGERIQETYTAYDDFPWEKIEEFLRVKWSKWDFKPQRFNDKWVFEVPEELTEVSLVLLWHLPNLFAMEAELFRAIEENLGTGEMRLRGRGEPRSHPSERRGKIQPLKGKCKFYHSILMAHDWQG